MRDYDGNKGRHSFEKEAGREGMISYRLYTRSFRPGHVRRRSFHQHHACLYKNRYGEVIIAMGIKCCIVNEECSLNTYDFGGVQEHSACGVQLENSP